MQVLYYRADLDDYSARQLLKEIPDTVVNSIILNFFPSQTTSPTEPTMNATSNETTNDISLSYCIANYAVTLDILALLVRKNYLTREDALESVRRARKLASLSSGTPGEYDYIAAAKECMEVIDQVFKADTSHLSPSAAVTADNVRSMEAQAS